MDWHRARKSAERARKLVRQGENDRGVVLLEEALGLWQGEPFTEFGGLWADSLRRSMDRVYERILGDWAGAKVALGQYDEVLDRLDEHPQNETLAFHHMRALIGAGRHTEAVECYTELREHTRAELGSEPNPRVRDLFQRILAEEGKESQEVLPQAGLSLVREGERSAGVVDTLRADVPDFLGREEELERLLSLVREAEGRTVVQTVTGMGGAGKTTLAVHAAHLLRDGFDVRLQTELSGVGPDQVLFRLLQMLGVPGGSVPADREARVAMWRSQTSGRRVLLLLDNASDQGQVAPVVPGSPGSVVLVTSRRSLAGLHGARKVNLGALDEEDAAQMFAAFSGREVEDAGMDRVVSLTGRLPIALRVASSQLRLHPTWSLGYLADRLESQGRAEVKGAYWEEALAVFADSFAELSAPAQRTFLCMGLHPTPVILDHAAAASVGSWDATEWSLPDLLDLHLIEEVSPGRYRMHDLVRKFALQRVAHVMSERERWAVEERVLEYYLATADNADRAARPGRRRTERPMVRSAVAQTFDTPREARDWFADSFPSVEQVIEYARDRGFAEYAARIPLAMAGLLGNNGPWDRAEQLFMDSVEVWHELDDRLGVAEGLYELALIRQKLGRSDGVEGLLTTATNLWEAHGGQQHIPYAREEIARFHALQGNHRRAIAEYQVALKEFRGLGDQRGVAKVFNRLAISHSETGRHVLASSFFLVSKQLYQALDDKQLEAAAALNLFQFHWARGRHREARALGERSLRTFEKHGDVLNAAKAWQDIGLLESYLGRHQQALDCFNAACRAYWAAGDISFLTRSRAGAGASLLGLGRVLEAEKTLEDALTLARSRNLRLPESPLLRGLGDVRLAQQRHAEARELYEAALAAAIRFAQAANAGMSCSQLGDLNSIEGDQGQALACWRRAVPFLERIPTPYLADVRSKIASAEYVQVQIAS